ncbi:MAG: transglycosylase domain-containing protein [Myxococcales bacterium]
MSKGRRRWGLAGMAGLGVLALCALVLALAPLPEVLEPGRRALVIRDARGGVLREPAFEDGLRARWVAFDDVPRAAIDAIVQSEDHHLGWHPGVDPLGIARAMWLDLRAGRVVAGGSTLAMQLARVSYGLPRTAWGKLQQAFLGMQLQMRLGSRGVLEAYVNLVPFGRDVRGLAMASQAYLGKPLRDATTGELVALACLVRAPSAYDPHRHAARLLARRHHVLALMHARGALSREARDAADAEPLHLTSFRRTFRAPHASALAFLEAERRAGKSPNDVETTLDPNLQRMAQRACKEAVRELERSAVTDCAAVVLRASSAEVLALVGSPDFHSPHAGQVNAALAPRQPGSALKPFLYALAFERGQSPGDTIRDEAMAFPAQFGSWIPENYDHRFHGEVTLREALANSYNVPAAKLALEIGIDGLLARLRSLGFSSLTKESAYYGPGLALGDGEVTLLDLVSAYGTLARGGTYQVPTLIRRARRGSHQLALSSRPARRVFSPAVTYLVGHVLQDCAARRAAFGEGSVLELPFAAAVKTGTSSRYRDNWAVGYAGDVVVGVWVGRHDGAPMLGVSGVSGAGPAFRRLMLEAAGRTAAEFPAPPADVALRRFGKRLDLALLAGPLASNP